MSPARRDAPALVGGLVVLAVGAVLLADRVGALSLTLAVLPPLFLAAVGAILLVTGLDGRDSEGGSRP